MKDHSIWWSREPAARAPLCRGERGVSLIEILVGVILLTLVCISSFTYFAYGLGGIGRQGNRRAALERATERLEQLMAAGTSQLPARDGQQYWCSVGNPCTAWVVSADPIAQLVAVNDVTDRRMEIAVKGVHDAAAGTPPANYDTWEIGIKVWFTSHTDLDDDFNRVYLKTLRAP